MNGRGSGAEHSLLRCPAMLCRGAAAEAVPFLESRRPPPRPAGGRRDLLAELAAGSTHLQQPSGGRKAGCCCCAFGLFLRNDTTSNAC